MNRLFNTSIELKSNESEIELKDSMKLEYYLLESILENYDELNGKATFGIEVIKKHGESVLECSKIENIFCSKEDTQNLLNMFARNSVTPVSMKYVLDDMLGA